MNLFFYFFFLLPLSDRGKYVSIMRWLSLNECYTRRSKDIEYYAQFLYKDVIPSTKILTVLTILRRVCILIRVLFAFNRWKSIL